MPIESRQIPLGRRIPWFEVVDLDGREWNTAKLPEGRPVLVAFLCNHSPYVVHIEAEIAELGVRAREDGIFFLGIASNDERAYPADRRSELRSQAERADWRFPYGFDESQRAAKSFGASCTPEFFLYDRDWRLTYHGQYDSSRPTVLEPAPDHDDDLEQAIDDMLAGRPVLRRQLPAFGCSIKWRAGNEPSYVFTG